MEKVNCAVLGATGVVGQHFLKLLVDHPYFNLTTICASDARKGLKLAEAKENVVGGIPKVFGDLLFDPVDVDVLVSKGVKVVFSALPADIAKEVESEAAGRGIKVFSNAGAHRMDREVPILIPEINHQHIELARIQKEKNNGFIVTNANCTTTGLTMAIAPLLSLGIKKLIVSSYQAISGAGYPGHAALDISANVIPFIQNEEPKVLRECRKIFGVVDDNAIKPVEWEIHAHCVRVPTIVGHLISVHIEVEEKPTLEAVTDLIRDFAQPDAVAGLPTAPDVPVLLTTDPRRPQPRFDSDAGTPERARGMAVFNGRLEVEPGIVRLVTLSNNLVRGAAGGSILNAELAFRENLL
jgi:aspartate-semialdehyde dehydrogenase